MARPHLLAPPPPSAVPLPKQAWGGLSVSPLPTLYWIRMLTGFPLDNGSHPASIAAITASFSNRLSIFGRCLYGTLWLALFGIGHSTSASR